MLHSYYINYYNNNECPDCPLQGKIRTIHDLLRTASQAFPESALAFDARPANRPPARRAVIPGAPTCHLHATSRVMSMRFTIPRNGILCEVCMQVLQEIVPDYFDRGRSVDQPCICFAFKGNRQELPQSLS